MDLLAYLGVDAVPKVRTAAYPVDVKLTTGKDRYAEVSALGITLPRLPVMPAHLTGWSGVQHLLDLHLQASKWTLMPEETQKKATWVWKSSVQKDPQPYLDAVAYLHELREQGKELSPLMWCWWRINQQLEEDFSGLAFKGIWHVGTLKNRKIRRWYYEEVNQDHIARRRVWPEDSERVLKLLQGYEQEASKIASTYAQSALWKAGYSAAYEEARASAQFIRDAAIGRVSARVCKYDLGVWLSADPISYLGLKQVRTRLVTSGLTAELGGAIKPILRKRKA